MTDSAKQAIVTVGIAVGVLFLFTFISKKKDSVTKTGKKKYVKPEADPKNMEENPQAMDAYAALCSYIDAYNDGNDATFLADLNAEFKKEMSLQVFENADGSISVEDLNGKEILVSTQMG